MNVQERYRRIREQTTTMSGGQACVAAHGSREPCVFAVSALDVWATRLFVLALGTLIASMVAAVIVVWPIFDEAVWWDNSGDYSRIARSAYGLIWPRAGSRVFVPIAAAAVSASLFGIAVARDRRCRYQRDR